MASERVLDSHGSIVGGRHGESRYRDRGSPSAPVAEIVWRLTAGREALVRRLEVRTEEQIGIVAIHPRLQKPMRLVDWVYFVAEHADHHLAQAQRVITTLKS